MRKMIIQFHATYEELVNYLNAVSHEFDLTMTAMMHFPFDLKNIESILSMDDISLDRSTCIILTKGKPNMDASLAGKFYDVNDGAITLQIGKLTDKGLKESALNFMSNDDSKIALAKKVFYKLKKITKVGGISVNSINGMKSDKTSWHRYTIGAKKLHDEGIKILSSGNVFFKLP